MPDFEPCYRGEGPSGPAPTQWRQQAQQYPHLALDIMIRHDRWHAYPHPDGVTGAQRVWPAASGDCGRVWPAPQVGTVLGCVVLVLQRDFIMLS